MPLCTTGTHRSSLQQKIDPVMKVAPQMHRVRKITMKPFICNHKLEMMGFVCRL